jgi:hypothetical protein
LDNETIQQIAAEVVHRLPYGDRPWLFLLVNAVVMAVVGILATLGTSYFRTRGQNLATKHDFEELKKQLKANTELVETIRSEVSQRDWTQREWTSLRRVKLEALFDKMHECETYLDHARSAANRGEIEDRPDVINQFDTISTLYFPELREEANEYYLACKELVIKILDLAGAVEKAGVDSIARQRAYADFQVHWPPKRRLLARNALRRAARALLERIMNVEKETSPSTTR